MVLGMTVCLPAKALTQDIDCFVLYEVIAFSFLAQQGACSCGYVEPCISRFNMFHGCGQFPSKLLGSVRRIAVIFLLLFLCSLS